MRRAPLLVLVLVLAACRGTQAYTSLDLQQVRHAYRQIPPVYRDFKAAYLAGNTRLILQDYAREQQVCRQLDPIDRRDTIDPSTNLFAASVGLDDLCNDIESAYASWASKHHRPFDKTIPTTTPDAEFVDGDAALEKMPAEMAHPAATGSLAAS